jgi:hypothetical protein
MIRKLLVVAAAIAMPVSAVAVSSGTASASSPHATAASDTIVCKDITGKVTFSPKEDTKGYVGESVKSTISATLSGCTVSGPVKETVTKGTVTGSITGAKGTTKSPAGTCAGLVAPSSTDTGTLTTKWTASVATPNSGLNVKSIAGGTTKSGYGYFDIPGSVKGTANGSFLGTNKGASDKSVSQTKLKASAIATTCFSSSGLSSIAITTESGTNAVSLG